MSEDLIETCLSLAKAGRPVDAEFAGIALNDYMELKVKIRGQDRDSEKDREIARLKNEVTELTRRLSAIAGHKMTDGNPGIADLSDPFRPTKLVEQFGEVYTNEWTEAFCEMKKIIPVEEEDDVTILKALAEICNEVFQYCRRLADQQFSTLSQYSNAYLTCPTYEWKGQMIGTGKEDTTAGLAKENISQARKHLKDFRKTMSRSSLPAVIEIFKSISKSSGLLGLQNDSRAVTEYVNRLLELSWLMNVQDPQMRLLWSDKGTQFQKNQFSFYTRKGTVVEVTVWPAVLLHEDGPLMAKGVVHVRH